MNPGKANRIAILSIVTIVAISFFFRTSLLCLAAGSGNLGAVKLLTALGAKVDAADGATPEKIPLECAIDHRRLPAARYLLSHGASPNRVDAKGRPALFWEVQAAETGTPEDFAFLDEMIRAGANINALGLGMTILEAAQDYPSMTEYLLNKGADPKAMDDYGLTVMHHAAFGESVPVLLKHGANPNVRTANGETPLHRTAADAGAEISDKVLANLELMIKAGMDPLAARKDGSTALAIAHEQGNPKLIAFLEAHGARWQGTPKNETTISGPYSSIRSRIYGMHRSGGCTIQLRGGEQMIDDGGQFFGEKGTSVAAYASCKEVGFLHAVVFGNGKIFLELTNLSAAPGDLSPLEGPHGHVSLRLEDGMTPAEIAWVLTEKPAPSFSKALTQGGAMLVAKQSLRVGGRGN